MQLGGTGISLDSQQLLDSLPCYAFVCDDTHRVLASNDWYRQESEAHALDGAARCFQVIHATDEPHHMCPLAEAVRTGMPAHKRMRDRSHGSLACEVYPLRNGSDNGEQLYLHLVKLA